MKPICFILIAGLMALRIVAQDPAPADPAVPPVVPAQTDDPATAPPNNPNPATPVPLPTVKPSTAPTATTPIPAPPTTQATNQPINPVRRGAALPPNFPRANAAGTNGAATPPAFPTLPGPRNRPGTNPANAATAAGPGGAATGSSTNDVPVQQDDEGNILAFKKMPLDQFLTMYQEAAGRIVLRGQNLPLQTQIDFSIPEGLTLTPDERIQMYDTILALNGVTSIPTGEKAILVVPSQQAIQEGAAFSTKDGGQYAEASQYVTHVVQLKYVEMQDAVDTVKQFAKNQNGIIGIPSSKTLILRDFAINVKRMLEVLKKIDVEVEKDWELEVIPIRYGRVEDISATMNSVISGGGGGGTGAATGSALGQGNSPLGQGGNRGGNNRNSSFGNNSSRYGRGGSGGYGGGYSGGYGGGYNQYSEGTSLVEPDHGFTPQQNAVNPVGTGTTPRTTFNQRLNQSARPGQQNQVETLVTDAQITPDPRSNSLIVYASKKDMAMIKKVLEKVDTLLPQVLIEGIVMNVSLQNGFSFGVSAGQRPKQFTGDVKGGGVNNTGPSLNGGADFLKGITNAYPTTDGFGYFAKLGNSWDVALNALASDSRVDVVQRPRIITSHAVPADFFVGRAIPYRQGGYSYGGQDSFYYQSLPVGIGLNVTPYITPDNLVVMEIGQNIDAVEGNFNPSSGIPPTTSNKSAQAIVTVRSGDVVLLGGFLDNTKTSGTSGVPWLKDIPLLGNLFKSRSTSDDKSELMILVRPTILPKPQDLADMTTLQRQASGNIQELERRMREDDEKSLKAAEASKEKKKKSFWRK